MNKSNYNLFPWKLSVFPLLQASFFFASVIIINDSLLLSFILLLLASIALNFSIHIFFHECVHRYEQYPLYFNTIASILLGLPFDGYRCHHYNHHFYENGLGDFSTTWIYGNNNKRAWPLFLYIFSWPRQLLTQRKCKTPFAQSFYSYATIKKRIPLQAFVIAILLLLLTILSWKILLLYVTLIYFGWLLTALQNYGQHPPIENGAICTIDNKLYNRILFNNGLHSEHHNHPSLSWEQLSPGKNARKIFYPHLLNPLIHLLGGKT